MLARACTILTLALLSLAALLIGPSCAKTTFEPGEGDSDSDSDSDSDNDSDNDSDTDDDTDTDTDTDGDTDTDADTDTDVDTDTDTDTGTGSDTGSDTCEDACSYAEDFEADNGAFTTSGWAEWAWGAPSSGPYAAHSGSNLWATDLYGTYENDASGSITSPDIDLSSCASAPTLHWWHWYDGEGCCDYISVEISSNGGTSWSTIYGPYDSSDITSNSWQEQTYALTSTYLVSNFRVRFTFESDYSVIYDGWYVDDVSVSLDECE